MSATRSTLASAVPFAQAPQKPDDARDAKADADKKEPKWDVAAEFGPTSKVTFDTSEGTWMNVDVSPDGRRIVFDLLGDIYTMPITGGKAKRLTTTEGVLMAGLVMTAVLYLPSLFEFRNYKIV